MYGWDLEREKTALEDALHGGGLDFSAAYMAVCDLYALVQRHPEVIRSKTISALEGVLKDLRFSSQTQSFFLCREAADALASIVVRGKGEPFADQAASALKSILGKATGNPKRACAEALGSLPVSISGPRTKEEAVEEVPRATWQEVLEQRHIRTCNAPAVIGRSLVVSMDEGDSLLVLKLASGEDSVRFIRNEALWMEHLCSGGYHFPVRFNIPNAIKIHGSYVFRLENPPEKVYGRVNPKPHLYAMGFVAHKDYFSYPNDHRRERRLTGEEFGEVMSRNAWLLGKLTSLGIVHCAPIPLFHNRVQRDRRADQGLYEWQRGGRLDRWLDSCCFPNFGVTGIRDFEHLMAFRGGGRKLYYRMGTQILSLLLVIGSYFRHKDKTRVGLDGNGNPVDARDLFHRSRLEGLVRETFLNYYNGFVGKEFAGEPLVDCEALASRMIEEMGVDRHMEEVLRVVDQRQMTDQEFRAFLATRGYSEEQALVFTKGVKDIVIYSGPHLGGFNERISLPELVECVGAMSALCILGRYWEEKTSGWASQ